MPIERLPEPLASRAHRVRCWALSDGPALLILGVGLALRGWTYLPHMMGPRAAASHPAEGLLTMGQWAIVWLIVGVLCVITSVWARAAPVALGLGVGLNLLWGASFIADAVTEHSARGWLPAVGYISVSLLVMWAVWRGSRTGTLTRSEVAHELRKP